MEKKHIAGKNLGGIVLYALSTCPWCRKIKGFFNDKGIEYDYIDVDLLAAEEKEEVLKTVAKWNPSRSFPTIVINDSESIVGYDENKIKRVLKL